MVHYTFAITVGHKNFALAPQDFDVICVSIGFVTFYDNSKHFFDTFTMFVEGTDW